MTGKLHENFKFIECYSIYFIFLLILLTYMIPLQCVASVNDYESIVNNTIEFNNTDSLMKLPLKKFYLFRGKVPEYLATDYSSLKGLHRGNIQALCRDAVPFDEEVKFDYVFDFLDYNGKRLSNLPFLYQFNPLSKVFGVNKYNLDESYSELDAYQEQKSYPYLGEYSTIVINKLFKMSLSEAGVLPKYSRFWTGNGCKNWLKGNNKHFGPAGYSDYMVNWVGEEMVRCTKKYYFLCLGMSKSNM